MGESARRWRLEEAGDQADPVTESELFSLAYAGKVGPDTRIRPEDEREFVRLAQALPDLFPKVEELKKYGEMGKKFSRIDEKWQKSLEGGLDIDVGRSRLLKNVCVALALVGLVLVLLASALRVVGILSTGPWLWLLGIGIVAVTGSVVLARRKFLFWRWPWGKF